MACISASSWQTLQRLPCLLPFGSTMAYFSPQPLVSCTTMNGSCRRSSFCHCNRGLIYSEKFSMEWGFMGQQHLRTPSSNLFHAENKQRILLARHFASLKSESANTSRRVGGIWSLITEKSALEDGSSRKATHSRFKPDDWLDRSIMEIVRNIQEAPFLHLVFESKGDTRTERQRVTRTLFETKEASEAAAWTDVRNAVVKLAPDGLILVGRLYEDLLPDDPEAGSNESYIDRGSDASRNLGASSCGWTNVWGILCLGDTVARSACYILKTTQVSSCAGICTRFCLTRAQCFGPSVREQLERMWLANS